MYAMDGLAWLTCPCHYIIGTLICFLCAEYAGYQTMDERDWVM